jgi:hypothetical protein
LSHRSADKSQQFAHPHDPTIQSRSRDFQTGLSLQDHALAIERNVIGIFAYYRIDYHSIASQTFLDDPCWQRCTLDSLLFTALTGSLFPLAYPHEVFGRFDIELLTLLVTDDSRLSATVAADTLFRPTGNDLFDPRQLRWQLLPARMFAHCSKR